MMYNYIEKVLHRICNFQSFLQLGKKKMPRETPLWQTIMVADAAQIPHCYICGVGWQLQLRFDP